MKLQIFVLAFALLFNGVAAWPFFDIFGWFSGLFNGGRTIAPVQTSRPASPPAATPVEVPASSIDIPQFVQKFHSAPDITISLSTVKKSITDIKNNAMLKHIYTKTFRKDWKDAVITVEYVLVGDKESMKGRLCSTSTDEALKQALACDGPWGHKWTSIDNIKNVKHAIMKFQVDYTTFGTIMLETRLDGTGWYGSPVYDTNKGTQNKQTSTSFDLTSVKVDFDQAIQVANMKKKTTDAPIDFNFVTLHRDGKELPGGFKFKVEQPFYQFGRRKEYRLPTGKRAPFKFVGAQDGCYNAECVTKVA